LLSQHVVRLTIRLKSSIILSYHISEYNKY